MLSVTDVTRRRVYIVQLVVALVVGWEEPLTYLAEGFPSTIGFSLSFRNVL